jgi:hypothetical protein
MPEDVILHFHRREISQLLQFLVTANVIPSSSILVTVMMEAIRSSETSVLTRATRRHVPEDGFLQSIIICASFIAVMSL